MRLFIYIFLSLAISVAIFFFFSSYKFKRWLDDGHNTIKELQKPATKVNVQDLPPLLRKYIDKVIIKKIEANYVYFTQSGQFRQTPEDQMSDFDAKQYVSLRAPMFSWVASLRMNGLSVTVCDRLINNRGALQARLFSAILLAEGSGDSFLRGELLRYLAEIPWYPTSILQQPNITWKQVSKNRVTGTIKIAPVVATVEYTFNQEGYIQSIFVPDREKGDGKTIDLLPWLGEFTQYEERDGVVIPIGGQVSWLLDTGKFTYFKGKITTYHMN